MADEAPNKEVKTALNLPENTEASLCYVLGWVSGIVFLLLEKDNKKIKFHALQSIVTFGVLQLISFVPVIGWVISPFVGILALILWLVLIIKAYQGEDYSLPIIGDFAKKQAGQ
jgi:uncharacterized membrane protein